LEYEKYSHIIRTLGFDYLTSVDYNDGLSNEVQSWDYDAAGNRISASANPGTWTYDNLNRMSASPGVIYTHDMVGNRTAKSVGAVETRYEWDAVNRMTKLGYPNSDYEYVYRSDGMRVRKIKNGGDEVTRSYYDGQMPVEEDVTTGGSTTLTRNFVGARGLEAISTTQNSVTNTTYPLYDTHGSMVATLTKNTGGTSWSIGDERSYDVWGSVRSGAATGGPKGRYVASLGHVQDDESGLIYMRARYYEPESGRFISEDLQKDGKNYYVYANNSPENFFDCNGNLIYGTWDLLIFVGLLAGWAIFNVNPVLGGIILAICGVLAIISAVTTVIQIGDALRNGTAAGSAARTMEAMKELENCIVPLKTNGGFLGKILGYQMQLLYECVMMDME
jgi:RHS repeat-associated protein